MKSSHEVAFVDFVTFPRAMYILHIARWKYSRIKDAHFLCLHRILHNAWRSFFCSFRGLFSTNSLLTQQLAIHSWCAMKQISTCMVLCLEDFSQWTPNKRLESVNTISKCGKYPWYKFIYCTNNSKVMSRISIHMFSIEVPTLKWPVGQRAQQPIHCVHWLQSFVGSPLT